MQQSTVGEVVVERHHEEQMRFLVTPDGCALDVRVKRSEIITTLVTPKPPAPRQEQGRFGMLVALFHRVLAIVHYLHV